MRKNGFTLIELMTSVVVMGIVAAIAISHFGDVRVRSLVAAVQSDLRHVHVAQEMYYQTHNLTYASGVDDLIEADLFRPSRGVTVEVNVVEPAIWEASATHESTGTTCDFHSATSVTECSYEGRSGRRITGPTNQTVVAGPSSD